MIWSENSNIKNASKLEHGQNPGSLQARFPKRGQKRSRSEIRPGYQTYSTVSVTAAETASNFAAPAIASAFAVRLFTEAAAAFAAVSFTSTLV